MAIYKLGTMIRVDRKECCREQTQTKQEQDTLELSNLENGKNKVNSSIG